MRSKKYKAMFKKHKKILKKIAKETDPFDFFHGLDYFVAFLEFMKDYYELGENVWGEEEHGKPTRLDTINEALEHFYKYQDINLSYEENRKEFKLFLDCIYNNIENWWD